MRNNFIAASLALTALWGCNFENAPDPAEELKEPELTVAEILDQFVQTLQPITALRDGKDVDEAWLQAAVDALGPKLAEHSGTENGKKAIERLEERIVEFIRESRDLDEWLPVKYGCKLFSVLRPKSDRYLVFEKRADLILAQPDVAMKGAWTDAGEETLVILEVSDPNMRQRLRYKVYEHDIFHHGLLRLNEIIGDNAGVEIEYLQIERKVDIYTRGRR